jgi:hypothetical protein
MLQDINHIINRNFSIRNFTEDKNAVLKANPGLRYDGLINGANIFSGNYFLLDQNNELIQSFNISIIVPTYGRDKIPVVITTDDRVMKTEEYHNSEMGICFEQKYFLNRLAITGMRLYDFIEFFFPRYFSWILLKQHGIEENLDEWAHGEKGIIQFYEELLKSTDKCFIKNFLIKYVNGKNNIRNKECYCGSKLKIKKCHFKEINFLNYTPRNIIKEDIQWF